MQGVSTLSVESEALSDTMSTTSKHVKPDNADKAPSTLIIVGAGQRGQVSRAFLLVVKGNFDAQIYSKYALQHPDLVKVTAVADLSPFRRKVTARDHQ
jgi:hypothetical protein